MISARKTSSSYCLLGMPFGHVPFKGRLVFVGFTTVGTHDFLLFLLLLVTDFLVFVLVVNFQRRLVPETFATLLTVKQFLLVTTLFLVQSKIAHLGKAFFAQVTNQFGSNTIFLHVLLNNAFFLLFHKNNPLLDSSR